jgi:ferredoxin
MVTSLAFTVGLILLLSLAYAAIQSRWENEGRAAGIFTVLAALIPLPYILTGVVEFDYATQLATLLVTLTGLTLLIFVVPTRGRSITDDDTPTTRIDERDIMFSRQHLEVGTERFEQYYRDRPDNRAADDAFRAEPGLLQKGSRNYHSYAFSAADASFTTVEQLRPLVDGKVAPVRVVSDSLETAELIKGWVVKLGARTVGITKLHDYHKYTVVGRGADYGKPVTLDHEFAVAFTVEMDRRMVDSAPFGPIAMESARQYLAAGAIAVQLAELIRALGFPARAHIDGNYRVICPLVARDAGLGEIGRMGLLMTPELGPRVRIAVVTTDLPLLVDPRERDRTMIDFCTDCKKCADACPSRAIPFDDRTDIDGVRRWQIDSEACFTLWCKLGTDCGRCMSVCPYSHPDNLLHRLVRRGIRHSALFRKAALQLDDAFYGRVPPPQPLPDWLDLDYSEEAAGSTDS